MIAGLILAAGAGTRLGIPKALVRYHDELLLDRAAGTLAAGGCEPVIAVLGAQAPRVRASAVREFHAVTNPAWRSGMGSSLRTGLRAMPAWAEAVVVLLVDQPGITAAAVRRVSCAVEQGADIAQAGYDGTGGHPVVFVRRLWPEVIASARGDRGARDVLRRHRRRVTLVPCEDIAVGGDIDTPQDAARWRRFAEQVPRSTNDNAGEKHHRESP